MRKLSPERTVAAARHRARSSDDPAVAAVLTESRVGSVWEADVTEVVEAVDTASAGRLGGTGQSGTSLVTGVVKSAGAARRPVS